MTNPRQAPTLDTRVAVPRLIVLGVLPVDDEVAGLLQTAVAPNQAAPTELPPALGQSLVAALGRHRAPDDQAPRSKADLLTQRERQVCDRIGEGLSNKQIASTLGIAIHTVKTHVRNILRKLGFASRVQVAVFGRLQGQTEWGPRLVGT